MEQEDITLLRERGKGGRRRQMTRGKYTRTYVEMKRMYYAWDSQNRHTSLKIKARVTVAILRSHCLFIVFAEQQPACGFSLIKTGSAAATADDDDSDQEFG